MIVFISVKLSEPKKRLAWLGLLRLHWLLHLLKIQHVIKTLFIASLPLVTFCPFSISIIGAAASNNANSPESQVLWALRTQQAFIPCFWLSWLAGPYLSLGSAPCVEPEVIERQVHSKCLSNGKYERNVSVKPVEGILSFGGAGLSKCVSDAFLVSQEC